MAVGLVGTGPAAAAVEAALADVAVDTESVDPAAVQEDRDLVVAIDHGNRSPVATVDETLVGGETPWIAVEIGAVGGAPLVDAAVTGFSSETGCYACLQDRVESNHEAETSERDPPSTATVRYAGAIAGWAAARYLDAGDEWIFGTVREIPHATRTLLPLPHCRCDGAGPPRLDVSAVDRPLDAALERAERALDERIGIVQEVGETASFPVPYYRARACETAGFSDASAARDAAGVALDWNAAFMKALGEALERYCAGVYRTASLPAGRPGEVANSVPPSAFVCRDTSAGDAALRWVEGRNLHTDASVRLPATFVYYPPPTTHCRPPITTGLGLGNGGVEALLAGLRETIERDAAVLAWYSTYEPLGLRVADDGFETLAARAGSEGLDVTALLLTQDVDVPVVAAAVRRETWPRVALGTAAGLDPNRAARRALAEALQNWTELRAMGPDAAAEAGGEIGRYADRPGPVDAFLAPETTVPAASVGPEDRPTGAGALTALLSRVAAAGLTAYGAATTTRDLATLGFEAVRVLVPSAQPLFFGEPYFGERAEQVPRSLGFEPRLDRDHHPFP